MMKMGETMAQVGSSLAGIMFVWATMKQFFPDFLQDYIMRWTWKLIKWFKPQMEIRFWEKNLDRWKVNPAYTAIESYLGSKSTDHARRLKGDSIGKTEKVMLVFSLDESEEIVDFFEGIQMKWYAGKLVSHKKTISYYPGSDERRYFLLSFHCKHKKLITTRYLNQVIEVGLEIQARRKQQKLFTNRASSEWRNGRKDLWSNVSFDHPATFENLAMEPKKKEEIINDLMTFTKSKEYYLKIGKAWKRGYLLYGPPGTGKSTMIAAIANLLHYDIYDLELTTIKNNSDLRQLLIHTGSKSIIVVEDIDCSLDITAQRNKAKKDEKEKKTSKKKKKKDVDDSDSDEDDDDDSVEQDSKVTLSGLLNFIDGIWSPCGGERLIIFTTNHIEKLDPALIRTGRMDKHIEMSYCGFEAFKVLAKNYLSLDSHDLFDQISELLGEVNVTPADVAENLMPKNIREDPTLRLEVLIEALKKAKIDPASKTEGAETKDANDKASCLWFWNHSIG
ncbi:hypothetical protein Droror1_Dr00024403 [Drosera rotundifolia]